MCPLDAATRTPIWPEHLTGAPSMAWFVGDVRVRVGGAPGEANLAQLLQHASQKLRVAAVGAAVIRDGAMWCLGDPFVDLVEGEVRGGHRFPLTYFSEHVTSRSRTRAARPKVKNRRVRSAEWSRERCVVGTAAHLL